MMMIKITFTPLLTNAIRTYFMQFAGRVGSVDGRCAYVNLDISGAVKSSWLVIELGRAGALLLQCLAGSSVARLSM